MYRDIIARARSKGRVALDEAAGKTLLAAFGISVPKSVVVAGSDNAAAALRGLTSPFAVKVISREILHKSDAGGVALNIADGAAVAQAIAIMGKKPGIAGKPIEGWLVEEMIPAGREIVIGGLNDPQFGPMLMVGLGGIFVEVLKDVSFRLCPITPAEASDMIAELKGAALLDGVRGEAGVDKQALIDVILKVGGPDGIMMKTVGLIAEVDLNPIIVSQKGAVAADARFILSETEANTVNIVPVQSISALESFKPLFEPKTVAVLGASTKDVTIANTFIRRMKNFGFAGEIYPIHPSAADIEGLKAYPSLGRTPQPVDYAYIAIGAERIPGVIVEANGRCRIAQVISSGFGEVEEGIALERA